MTLPLILEPSALAARLADMQAEGVTEDQARLRLVDLRSAEAYADAHLPGAVHGNAALLNRSASPVGGLMPEPECVNSFLADIGVHPGYHIIAYDEGRATPAARMIWVLDAYGYRSTSWLAGGFTAWKAQGLPICHDRTDPAPGTLSLQFVGGNVISAERLMDLLDAPGVSILDVRSAGEYDGRDIRSAFGGHVPGARHLEWTEQLDQQGRLLDERTLRAELEQRGISRDDTVVVYCQTHQRSAVTYVVLRHLGYEDVRALDGAWSNWGNRADTPKS